MKRKWLIPVAAAALALVTTVAVVGYLQRVGREAQAPKPVETAMVVVAKANIAERKIVGPDLIALRSVPVTAIHPSAARRIEDVSNRVALVSIYADEQVLLSKLAPVGVNVGLSYVLPKDKRAMTIAVNEVIGVAGFIFPGDRIDVLATVDVNDQSLTKIALQDIQVLAIAQKVDQRPGEEPRVTTSVTLSLAPEQTEALTQLDTHGKLRLALRPYGGASHVQTAGMTTAAALRTTSDSLRSAVVVGEPVASINRTVSGASAARTELVSVRRIGAEPASTKSTTRIDTMAGAPNPSIPLPPPIPAQAPQLTPPPVAAPEPPRLPGDTRLTGVVAGSDGRRVAVIRSNGQTYFVEPGQQLFGFTVVLITENKVVFRLGTTSYELFF